MKTEIMHDGASMLVVDTETGEVLREYVTKPYDQSNHKAIPQENYYTGIKSPDMLRDWCLENGYKATQEFYYDKETVNGCFKARDARRFKQLGTQVEYINYVFTTNRELQELWDLSRTNVGKILKKWVDMGVINYTTLNLSSRNLIRIEIHPQLICKGRMNIPDRLYNFLQRNEVARDVDGQGIRVNLTQNSLTRSLVNINRALTNVEAGYAPYTDWDERTPDYRAQVVQSGFNRFGTLMAKNKIEWDLMMEELAADVEEGDSL